MIFMIFKPTSHMALSIRTAPFLYPLHLFHTMEFPEEVIAVTKRGKREVRSFIDRGTFVRYAYLDPETGERKEKKYKLVLKREDGTVEEYFVIPTGKNRFLMLRGEGKGPRKIMTPDGPVELYDML